MKAEYSSSLRVLRDQQSATGSERNVVVLCHLPSRGQGAMNACDPAFQNLRAPIGVRPMKDNSAFVCQRLSRRGLVADVLRRRLGVSLQVASRQLLYWSSQLQRRCRVCWASCLA